MRLIIVALLDAGPQLALHALDAAAVAGAVPGALLLGHRRRRHRAGAPRRADAVAGAVGGASRLPSRRPPEAFYGGSRGAAGGTRAAT